MLSHYIDLVNVLCYHEYSSTAQGMFFIMMVKAFGILVFVLLLVFFTAKGICAFFHRRRTFNYQVHTHYFSLASALVVFGVIGLAIGGYSLPLLSDENQWVGWTAAFSTIVVSVFFVSYGVITMVKSWKKLHRYC